MAKPDVVLDDLLCQRVAQTARRQESLGQPGCGGVWRRPEDGSSWRLLLDSLTLCTFTPSTDATRVRPSPGTAVGAGLSRDGLDTRGTQCRVTERSGRGERGRLGCCVLSRGTGLRAPRGQEPADRGLAAACVLQVLPEGRGVLRMLPGFPTPGTEEVEGARCPRWR